MPDQSAQNSTRTLVRTVVTLLVVLAAVAIVGDAFYINAHNLPVGTAAPLIAATAGAVSALAGLVSALFAAVASARSSDATRQIAETATRATEALSRAMLPDTIDLMVRIEGTEPRFVVFSVDSQQLGWRLTNAVREGAGGPEPAATVPIAQGAIGWRLPDWVHSNADFERWIIGLTINISDVKGFANWGIRQSAGTLTYPATPQEPVAADLRAPILLWSVQQNVQRVA